MELFDSTDSVVQLIQILLLLLYYNVQYTSEVTKRIKPNTSEIENFQNTSLSLRIEDPFSTSGSETAFLDKMPENGPISGKLDIFVYLTLISDYLGLNKPNKLEISALDHQRNKRENGV